MTVVASDGVELHAESAGRGDAILFVHEYAGDHRSWEPQLRRFSRSRRCITYAARGYPPSQVPAASRRLLATAGRRRRRRRARRARRRARGRRRQLHGRLRRTASGAAAPRARPLAGNRRHRLRRPSRGGAALPRRVRGHRPADSGVGDGVLRPPLPVRAGARPVSGTRTRGGGSSSCARWASTPRPARLGTLRGVQQQRPSLHSLEAALSALEAPVLILAGDEDGRLPRDQPVAQARHSPRRSRRPAEVRPHAQPRGARPRQRVHRGLPGPRGGRRVGTARRGPPRRGPSPASRRRHPAACRVDSGMRRCRPARRLHGVRLPDEGAEEARSPRESGR